MSRAANRRQGWLLAALAAGGACSKSGEVVRARWREPELAATQPDTKVAFRYGWPVPGSVQITETGLKRDVEVTTAYDFRLAPDPGSDEVLASYANFEYLMVQGRPATDTSKAELDKIVAAIPSLRLGSGGAFLGIHDVDGFLARMEAAIGPAPQLRAMLAKPGARVAFEQKVARFWRAWVSSWSGLEAEPGTVERLTPDRELLRALGVEVGSEAETVGIRTFHGMVAAPAGHAYVSWTMAWDFEAGQLAELLRGLDLPAGDGAPGHLRLTMAAVVDPKTLRPARARWEEEVVVEVDGTSKRRVERREYEFDWSPRPPGGG